MGAHGRGALTGLAAGLVVQLILFRLGRAAGSTRDERAKDLPGDGIIERPTAITDHAITIDAPPEAVWPWLVQMGWHQGGWYTARWVDRLLFPANWPSADVIIPELQGRKVGDFIPDGAPETECGLFIEVLEPNRALVLHSNSHLPASWRRRDIAAADWSWAFVLASVDGGARTRFHFRSRWWTRPWWLTLAGWMVLVPADFLMARDMLRGIRQRAESTASDPSRTGLSALPSSVDFADARSIEMEVQP